MPVTCHQFGCTGIFFLNPSLSLSAQPVKVGVNGSSNTSTNPLLSGDWSPRAEVQVTELRKNPNYIIYYINWFGFISTGVLPMALLVFFNVNIYRKVLETRRVLQTFNCGVCNAVISVDALTRRNRMKKKASAAQGGIGGGGGGGGGQAGNGHGGHVNGKTAAVVLNSAQTAKLLKKQEQQVSKKEIKMAIVLLAIVLIFFFCHLPR